MARRQYFAVIDTESTQEGTVADFAAVITDRQGRIHAQAAVLVAGHYGHFELFHRLDDNGDIWGLRGLHQRKAAYENMLQSGARMLATPAAINRWLDKAVSKYNPILTAYNLSFDVGKCANTGIDLSGFNDRFCLWHAAVGSICNTRAYRQFILENHAFNPPTDHGNMSFITNAEVVSGFINGSIEDEPHTALEDITGFEIPILKAIVNKRRWREKIEPYSWGNFQVRDWFKPR